MNNLNDVADPDLTPTKAYYPHEPAGNDHHVGRWEMVAMVTVIAIAAIVGLTLIVQYKTRQAYEQALSDCYSATTSLGSSLDTLDEQLPDARTLLEELSDIEQPSPELSDATDALSQSLQEADHAKSLARQQLDQCVGVKTTDTLLQRTTRIKESGSSVDAAAEAVKTASGNAETAKLADSASGALGSAKSQLQTQIDRAQEWLNSEEGQQAQE